jgi:hypothetical protein
MIFNKIKYKIECVKIIYQINYKKERQSVTFDTKV